MNIKHFLLAAVVSTSVAAPVLAQTASREAVKAEAKTAVAQGSTSHGEGSPTAQPKLDSAKTRADRKAETKAARQRGEVLGGGETATPGDKAKPAGAVRNRADVKAETRSAVKAGQIPSGEKN